MALSGSTDFSYDRDTLIQDAFALIGVGVDGETLQTADTNKGSRALNSLVKSWSIYGPMLWSRKTDSLTLTTDTASYTLGPSGDKVMDRPIRILQAWRRDSNSLDIPLEIITRSTYNDLSDKTTTGIPSQVYYDRTLTNGTLYVWPVPNSTQASEYTVRFEYHDPFDDLDSATDDFEFTQEWYLALLYNLAAILADFYGLSPTERGMLRRSAKQYLDDALSADTEDESTYFEYDQLRNI